MKKINYLYIFIILFLITYYYIIFRNNIWFNDYLIYYMLIFPFIFGYIIKIFTKFNFLICYFIGIIIQWICFLNINPVPLFIDNKLSSMKLFQKEFIPEVQFSLVDINKNKFTYPIIIKPTICSGDRRDINIINSNIELNNYLKTCKNSNEYMVQNYLVDYDVEIGLMWRKFPWEKEGKIIEIIERTNKEDKLRPTNDKYLVDHLNLINNNLNILFNKIAKFVPNLNICRYDIRLKNINDLQKGKFKIIEVNGNLGRELSEFADIFNNNMSVILFYFERILIGFINIITLNGYNPINLIIIIIKTYYNMIKCIHWEKLYINW